MKSRALLTNPFLHRLRKRAPSQPVANWLHATACIGVLSALLVAAGVSQQVPQPNGGLPGPGRTSQGFAALPESANPHPDSNRVLEDSMRRQDTLKRTTELNELRQKEMSSDTVKLVVLANELKTQLEKPSNDPLSMNEVRKVEEIERLAHGVQSKMKATVAN